MISLYNIIKHRVQKRKPASRSLTARHSGSAFNSLDKRSWTLLRASSATNGRTHGGHSGSESSLQPRYCGQQFASFHALRTHIGKSHPESSVALTKTSYANRSERKDDHVRYAKEGRPQCSQCLKKCSGWPACMAHFNQKSCPVLHVQSSDYPEPAAQASSSSACGAPAGETIGVVEAAEPIPIFQLDSTASQCISLGACQRHGWIQQAQAHAQVVQWAKNCQVPSNPCRWCGSQYSTTNKARRNACPILWMCGQLLALHGHDRQRGSGQSNCGAGVL